jgi:hypothetical protein
MKTVNEYKIEEVYEWDIDQLHELYEKIIDDFNNILWQDIRKKFPNIKTITVKIEIEETDNEKGD